MKLLFDQNLSFKLCQALTDLFPGSSQVRLIGMAALYGHPPKVIWLRCGNQPTHMVEQRLRSHAQDIAAFEQDPKASCLEIL
jgi:predicted nuclease of predicted toxin-antitoxin system